eukprot:CAMPEP_0115264314 /NCGR_PEP_ID=MMETSP0270-20121206/50366_1 /TAXON_ID=71861 /ORGANISM="Scrippsiella trochoidea, Strain CCMP3099" /LENGTH=104 /DNA_ID=CAMNT_0002680331 /DNA_START=388 /DNA_END=702 /DNA_ORIENTATION=+
MTAMVAMELKHCEKVIERRVGCISTLGAVLTTLVAYALLAVMAVEAWATARYYHTREASFVAFFTGLLLWGSFCWWWRGKIHDAYDNLTTRDKLLKEGLLKGAP